MPANNNLEIATGQPMIAFESDFVDYQETQKLCPTREVEVDSGQWTADAEIRQIAAALTLLDLCQNDAAKARKAIDLATRIRDGSISQFLAQPSSNTAEGAINSSEGATQ